MLLRTQKLTPLPVTLDRHRVYIFPTRQGFVFILVLVAMLAGSINYNNNLGFLLVFLLGGMALVSMLHTYRNILGLQVMSVSAGPVFAGDDAVFDMRVRSGGHDRKVLALSAAGSPDTKTDLQANADQAVPVIMPAHQRGLLRPESFTLSTVYPLGLFCAWTVLRPGAACTVYPAPIGGAMAMRTDDSKKGDRQKGIRSGSDDFKGLKAYQPGDAFQHIAWKALSRGQGLFTKDFGGAKGRRAVVFDFFALRSDDTEFRLSRLCAMILQASLENRQYGLALPGKTIPPDSGSAHRHQCLTALATFEADTSHE